MEKQEYRTATEEDHGKIIWFGDFCQECGAPNVKRGTTHGPYYGGGCGYTWELVQHSCVQHLKERIDKLEKKTTPKRINVFSRREQKFNTFSRRENKFNTFSRREQQQ